MLTDEEIKEKLKKEVKIFDYEDRLYFLIDDTMREIMPHAYGEYNKTYYSFNRSKIIVLPEENELDSFISVECDIINVEDNTNIGCDIFELKMLKGILSPKLRIGCRIFIKDDMQILVSWLKANENIKPYLERREKELQKYYDGLNKPNS